MYNFSTEASEQTTEKVTDLVESLVDMEISGDLTDEDLEQCIYYLQKISQITGAEVDFDTLNDEYGEE